MEVLRGLDVIRRRPEFYLGSNEPSGKFLGAGLAECALRSGARRVKVEMLMDGWVSVSADRDWITPSLPENWKGQPPERVIVSLVPQIGGQQNEIRFEAMVAAFSQCLMLKSEGEWKTLFGDEAPGALREAVDDPFAILFRPEHQDR
jgi:hypothetical protein